jgi:hypoxanthine phosphoribosyltransferase
VRPSLLLRSFSDTTFRLTKGPDLFIAIGGGGFIPARILRTFCKTTVDGSVKKNIPIQAVGLVLYESMGGVCHLSSSCLNFVQV